MSSRNADYIQSGYDPNDGLVNGRWMRDTWGVQAWVQIGPATRPRPEAEIKRCADCPTAIDKRATRCRECSHATLRGRKRAA